MTTMERRRQRIPVTDVSMKYAGPLDSIECQQQAFVIIFKIMEQNIFLFGTPNNHSL